MRVLIADDSVIVRAGVSALLTEAGCEVVAAAANGDEAVELCVRLQPDIAVVDIRMPPTHTDEGLRAAGRIRELCPGTGVLVLSQFVEPGYALRLLGQHPAGMGYLLKDRVGHGAVLVDALTRLAADECVIDPTIVSQLMRRTHERSPVSLLSEREREVLAQLAEGRSNAGIASALFITERTVESHTTQIFLKLGLIDDRDVHRRVLAVLTYLRDEHLTHG